MCERKARSHSGPRTEAPRKPAGPRGRPSPTRGRGLADTSSSSRGGDGTPAPDKEPGKPPGRRCTRLTPARERAAPEGTGTPRDTHRLLPTDPLSAAAGLPAPPQATAERRGLRGELRRAPPALSLSLPPSRSQPPPPPPPPPPAGPGALRAGRNCVTLGAEGTRGSPAGPRRRYRKGGPQGGRRRGAAGRIGTRRGAERRGTPPRPAAPSRRWGRWRTGASLRRALSEVKPELAFAVAAPGRTGGGGDPHHRCVWRGTTTTRYSDVRPRSSARGPASGADGAAHPLPGGRWVFARRSSEHARTDTDRQTDRDTPPPPPPHLKAQGSFPPGTVPPRRPALRCRGRSRCLPFPPFSFLFLWRGENPARGLRGAEGAPATCRRGGEGGRPGRPARGGGGEEGSRAEPSRRRRLFGSALLGEGRKPGGSAGWGCPRRQRRARSGRALG